MLSVLVRLLVSSLLLIVALAAQQIQVTVPPGGITLSQICNENNPPAVSPASCSSGGVASGTITLQGKSSGGKPFVATTFTAKTNFAPGPGFLVSPPQNWLRISTASSTKPATNVSGSIVTTVSLTVTTDPTVVLTRSALYLGYVTISSPGATVSPGIVPVSLSNGWFPPNTADSPAAQLGVASPYTFPSNGGSVDVPVNFQAGATPAPGPFFVSTVQVGQGQPNWLGVAQTVTPLTTRKVTLAANVTGLVSGQSYDGLLIVQSSDASGNPNSDNPAFLPVSIVGPLTSPPVPTITNLNPGSSTANATAFTLTVNGTGFLSGAIVQWNGSALPTAFVSATQVTASVAASLVAVAGSASITVSNPGGALSSAFPFAVAAATAPAITSVTPPSVLAGSASITVTITGSGFTASSMVLWNGFRLATTYLNSTAISAQITAADLVNVGIGQITVQNATGAASNSFSFTIASGSSLQFVTVAPCRIMDTRSAMGTFGGPAIKGSTARTIPVPLSACSIPSNASAYSLNFTVVPKAGTLSFLSVWPTGQPQPFVSTLNSPQGSVVANAAIVPAGNDGAINAFATDDTDLILDINGYFVTAAPNTLQFYSLMPCRLLDTRNSNGLFGGPSIAGGTGRSFPVSSSACGTPTNAAAFALNITAVPHGPLGYLTAWPTDQSQPLVSTLNSYDGTVVANAAIVPAGTSRSISLYLSDTADVVVDINGYFAPPGSGGLNFHALPPCRLVDTRNPTGTLTGPSMTAGTTRAFPLLQGSCGLQTSAGNQAYSLNITVVPQGPLGYLSTWPTGQAQPLVSTLNAYQGQIIANAAIVPAGLNGSINVYVTNPTDVIIDTNGYFGPE